MAIGFDELSEDGPDSQRNSKPIWTLDLDNESKRKELQEWLNAEVDYLLEENSARFELIRRHLALYKGIQYWSQGRADGKGKEDSDALTKKSRGYQKFTINHLFDLTAQRISRLVEYKPSVGLIPPSDDWGDKMAAKSSERILDNIWYTNNFTDTIVPEMAKWSRVMGEAYSFVLWDPDKGPEHPDWVKAQSGGKRVPLLDHNGKQVEEDGKKRFIDEAVHIGDVGIEYDDPFNVLLERNGKFVFENVDYCFRRKVMTLDAAHQLYPEAKGKLNVTKNIQVYDFERMEMRTLSNMVVAWTMYHRPTRFMGKGAEIVFTKDAICKKPEKHKYKHKKLPCTRLTDITHPRDLHGHSFFENIKGGTGAYNNLTNMLMRNAVTVAHPKWMLPVGSAKLEQLSNEITIVQFRGPVAPRLENAQVMSPDMFRLRGELKADFQQVAQVHGVSRGEPPPGVDAAIALQFLEEQEDKAATPDTLAMDSWIKATSSLALSVAADNYEESDDRTVRLMGRNGAWQIRKMKVADVDKGYEVQIAKSSALPKSRTARMQALVYLQKNYPGMIPPQQVMEMMDMAQNQKFMDAVTVAVRAAEEENDRMLESMEVKEPDEWEDHLQHWTVHCRQVQEHAFKYQFPEEVKQAFIDHIIATEMLMVEKAMKNPMFGKMIASLPNFPLFYEPGTPMPDVEGAPAGEATAAPQDELAPASGAEPQEPAAGAEEQQPSQDLDIPQPPAINRP